MTYGTWCRLTADETDRQTDGHIRDRLLDRQADRQGRFMVSIQ